MLRLHTRTVQLAALMTSAALLLLISAPARADDLPPATGPASVGAEVPGPEGAADPGDDPAEPVSEVVQPDEGNAEPQESLSTEPVAPPVEDNEPEVVALVAPIDESTLVGLAGAPVSDGALIAWVGPIEPATKVTLQGALTSAVAGDVVHIVPGAYQFTSVLTVTKALTIEAASTTQLFGRMTLSGASVTFLNVILCASAASVSVLTVTTPSGATLGGVYVANPDNFLGSSIGINLGLATGATVTAPVISGMATGIAVGATNVGAGPTITDATITFRAKGITLGGTLSPSIVGSTLTGPGGTGTMGIDYATSAGVTVTDTTISGVLAGISTSTLTNTRLGPQITGGSIEAIGNGINLAATSGATVSSITLTCVVPTNSASAIGVNVHNADTATIADVTASGFATGVGLANTNSATGIRITGGDLSAVTNAITLGAATSPVVLDTTVRGQARAGVVGTTGVNVFNATGALIQNLTSLEPRRGISVAVGNASTGLRVLGGTFQIPDGSAATGIDLGGASGPVVDSPTLTGTSRTGSRAGITTNRATAAVITDATISTVVQGISGVWVRGGGTPLAGHTITGARISDVGIGIYTANTDGTTVNDAIIDAYGEGLSGHEDANITLTNSTFTGHPGAGLASSGTNCVRFYYTHGITVTNVTMAGGSTGLYLDMSYDAVATNLDISGALWYATYAESITGYELRNSDLHDNAGIANLTINPSSIDSIDLRQVSSDIVFEDNTMTDNLAGIYLPLGAYDFTLQRNVISGTRTYVLYAVPAHQVTVANNRIDYTHDASLLSAALDLGDLPSLGDPPPEPPIEGTPPPDLEPAAFGDPIPFEAEVLTLPCLELAIASPIPPPSPASAIWIAPTWFNLDTQSASSDDIVVLANIFAGDGPFLGVGSVSTVDKGTLDAPDDASAMRTLRDTIEVSRNVFPTDSTAIVTVADAEVGLDADTSNQMINGNAAVDARGNNDWGSPCYARAPTDGYDGGGAFVHEIRDTQVLYPQGCTVTPAAGGIAAAGISTMPVGPALALILSGTILLLARRRPPARISPGDRLLPRGDSSDWLFGADQVVVVLGVLVRRRPFLTATSLTQRGGSHWVSRICRTTPPADHRAGG